MVKSFFQAASPAPSPVEFGPAPTVGIVVLPPLEDDQINWLVIDSDVPPPP